MLHAIAVIVEIFIEHPKLYLGIKTILSIF